MKADCRCRKDDAVGADRDPWALYLHELAPDCVVDCDANCKALLDPNTPGQVRAAFEHWRSHENIGGCSHGS